MTMTTDSKAPSVATAWQTLVTTEALASALRRDELVVVDCRFSLAAPQAGESAYRQAHVPGARYAHLDRDLSDHDKPAAGRHPWPDAEAFTSHLEAWGITPRHQVVAYDDGDGAYAARLWFLLRALGHANVAVLDGGWARWTAAGLPVDAAIPAPRSALYVAAFDDSRLLDAARVQAHLAAGGIVLDARAAERFRGDIEPIDRIAGHVPGAINRPYADNLVDGGFKSSTLLAREFHALLGARHADEVVAMCGSGVTACHHLLAMECAGLPGAKLFTGSWSGWISDPARPVANGPAP
jgi:thiosulfate/3-mercaptopyruvate sulfurtransferase